MKILMLAPQPVLEPRGTPISVYHRLLALSALNHQVDLVTYHLGAPIDIPGVKVNRIPSLPFITRVKVGPSWPKLLLDFLLFGKALILLCRRKYDVIHSHEEAAYFAMLLAFLFRTRHIYDMHSSLPTQLGAFRFGRHTPARRLFRFMERWVLHTCDAVITISPELQAYVLAVNPTVSQIVIENLPLQADQHSASQGSLAALGQLNLDNRYPIVYTGTFEPYQGLDILLSCAKLVAAQCPAALFIFVGGRPEQVLYWRHEADKLGLNGHIYFTGVVPVEEVGSYLKAARILVSARTQGLSIPLKIYSYLYAGRPIVATNIDAHTAVLNPEVAKLVNCTPEAFAAGILELIRAPEQAESLGIRAGELARKRYRFTDYVAKVGTIYHSLDEHQPRPEQIGQEYAPAVKTSPSRHLADDPEISQSPADSDDTESLEYSAVKLVSSSSS